MGEHHGHARAITQHPPERSRLAEYVRHFEGLEAQEPPLWQSADPVLRTLGRTALLREEQRWSVLPEPVLSELVVDTLVAQGMPDGYQPGWLEMLVDTAVDHLRLTSAQYWPEPSRKPRAGHPPPKLLPFLVVCAAYLDAVQTFGGSATQNRIFEAVAERLGPGINRHHVRRVIQRFHRGLGRPGTDRADLLLLAGLCFANLMRTYDETRPPRGARKPGSVSSLFARTA